MIEIVLAVGIIAFALVAIIGLFPVALGAAASSQRETQAAFIARSIYNDLTSLPGPKTFVVSSKDYYSDEGNGDENGRIDIDLSTSSSHYIAFSAEGEPIKEIPAGTFREGTSEGAYVAAIKIVPAPASAVGSTRDVAELEIRVEGPGAAPATRRESHSFLSLLRYHPTLASP